MQNVTAGNGLLTWTVNDFTLTWTAPGDAAGTPVKICPNGATVAEGFYKIYSNDTDNWIIVKVTGTLGVIDQNCALAGIALDETPIPRDSILKLCVTHWDTGPMGLSNLRDIRRFNTVDNRVEFEEEHDETGRHTKALQQTFRVGVQDAYAIDVVAESSFAIRAVARGGAVAVFGQANNTGVYGSAVVAKGVYGYAANFGVVGSAGGICGVSAAAPNTAIWGSAAADIGVYAYAAVNTGLWGRAFAGNTGVYGQAAGDYGVAGRAMAGNIGVYGSAAVNTGVYGHAEVTGVYGHAAEAGGIGVCGKAVAGDTGVWGSANGATGVYGQAGVIGVYGYAAGNTGVWGYAANIGVYGYAVGDIGVKGEADNTGVYGSAGVNTGIYGTAVGNYGVHGKAAAIGVNGEAVGNYGVMGYAGANTGGIFEAAGVCGVCGVASNKGGLFVATGGGAGVNNIVIHCASGTIEYDVATVQVGLKATQDILLPILYTNAGGAVQTGYFQLWA